MTPMTPNPDARPLMSVYCEACKDYHLVNDALEIHSVIEGLEGEDEACFTCPHTGQRVTGVVLQ